MLNKILGGLYGQALGDAFAMPAQVHPDDTERAFGWLESWQAAPDDHIVHAGLPAGRITDDSEQAFSIAQAVIDAGAVTLEAAVSGIVSWYDRVDGDNSPYVGPSTRRGVNALKAGEKTRGPPDSGAIPTARPCASRPSACCTPAISRARCRTRSPSACRPTSPSQLSPARPPSARQSPKPWSMAPRLTT